MSSRLMNFIIYSVRDMICCLICHVTDLDAVEDPSRLQAAAEVSVDILFAAFEKFLKVVWREHMGPLLAVSVIQSMQSKFGTSESQAVF